MANFTINEIIGDITPKVTVVDIGAMRAGKSRYDVLVERGMGQVIGFEPEPTEFEKLKAHADQRHVYLSVLWEKYCNRTQPGIQLSECEGLVLRPAICRQTRQ